MEGPENREQKNKKRLSKEIDTEDKKNKSKRRARKERIRLIPIWLRLVIIFVLVTLSLMTGAMVGFGFIGNGDPIEALHPSTWKHILDIINAVE